MKKVTILTTPFPPFSCLPYNNIKMNNTENTYYPDELIAAYLNNELNKEQRIELEKWVAADAAHKQYFYEMTEIWLAANATAGSKEESERAFQHFRGRLSKAKLSRRFSLSFCADSRSSCVGNLIDWLRFLFGRSSVGWSVSIFTGNTDN